VARPRWTRRARSPTFSSLWCQPEFLKFWAGQSVSLFGTQFSLLAIPLAAALTLHASSAQMGFMGAAQFAPALVSGPFIGVWLHRARRRPKTSRTIAQLAGPAIAGCGVRLITAPLAIAFDAASFLVGALTAASIPTHEDAPAPAEARRHILSEARQGLSFQALHWCGYACCRPSPPSYRSCPR